MNCTNCNKPSATDYCADCEQYRERLEELRERQQQRLRDYRSGKLKIVRPPKGFRGGHHFMEQCRRYAKQKEAAKAGPALPLSGQDAALPPGDR